MINRFFTEGIKRMNGSEDVVTIGMRGDGDEAMSDKTDTQLLSEIIDSQRKIIKKSRAKSLKRHRRFGLFIKRCLIITTTDYVRPTT